MDYDVLILGGGVVGCSVAYELSKYNLNIALIEKDYDVADDISFVNTTVVYDGSETSDAEMARLENYGQSLIEQDCKKFNVPYKKVGALRIANTEDGIRQIEKMYTTSKERGIDKVFLIDSNDVYDIEPNINVSVKKALYSENVAIIAPYDLTIAYAEVAADNGVNFRFEEEVIKIAKDCEIDFKDNNIYLNGEILKDEIRTMEVSNNVSNVAKIKEVRYLMVDVQRNIGKVSSVILDGRDIGSYVFPNADYKFFLVATPEERGKRRYKELVNKGYDVNLEEIISDIIKRDEIDSNREFAPLVKADDAIEIDTTGKSINEVVQSVLSKINI